MTFRKTLIMPREREREREESAYIYQTALINSHVVPPAGYLRLSMNLACQPWIAQGFFFGYSVMTEPLIHIIFLRRVGSVNETGATMRMVSFGLLGKYHWEWNHARIFCTVMCAFDVCVRVVLDLDSVLILKIALVHGDGDIFTWNCKYYLTQKQIRLHRHSWNVYNQFHSWFENIWIAVYNI